MKSIFIAAGALLLIGTSANAFAPVGAKELKTVSMPDGGAVGLKATVAKFDKDDTLAMVQPASMDWGKPGKPDAVLTGEMGGPSYPATVLGKPDMSQYTGMGGPLEEVDYPPCSRTVTDRCIQLYERGVRRR